MLGFQAACVHLSVRIRKKDINSTGSQECGKNNLYITETVVFSPRLRKAKEKLEGSWLNVFTFSHVKVEDFVRMGHQDKL